MTQQPHGGDIYGFDAPPLDFSANISPLGLPDRVRDVLEKEPEIFSRYPDPHCRKLCAALAKAHGLRPEWVLCGNGAADLLYRLAFALRPRTALIPVPTFSEYERALTAAGCVCRSFPLCEETDFQLTEAILPEITPELSMLVLCNPNNPTGQPVAPELFVHILQRCAQCDVLLLTDECFVPFLEQVDDYTATRLLEDHPNLLILRAFTKFYAMAGLRLGYLLCADTALLGRVAACGQPWPVSGPAQAAGLAALGASDYAEAVRKYVGAGRTELVAALRGMDLRVIGSQANFIFFHSGRDDLYDRLLERGILIRSCENFAGLNAHYYRVAVKTTAENVRLIAALESILKGE